MKKDQCANIKNKSKYLWAVVLEAQLDDLGYLRAYLFSWSSRLTHRLNFRHLWVGRPEQLLLRPSLIWLGAQTPGSNTAVNFVGKILLARRQKQPLTAVNANMVSFVALATCSFSLPLLSSCGYKSPPFALWGLVFFSMFLHRKTNKFFNYYLVFFPHLGCNLGGRELAGCNLWMKPHKQEELNSELPFPRKVSPASNSSAEEVAAWLPQPPLEKHTHTYTLITQTKTSDSCTYPPVSQFRMLWYMLGRDTIWVTAKFIQISLKSKDKWSI